MNPTRLLAVLAAPLLLAFAPAVRGQTNGLFTTLHSFSALNSNGDNSDGAMPSAPLILGTDGNLYGTASTGGTLGQGTAFKITTAGELTVVHTFGPLASLENPIAELVQVDGVFYGTTRTGGGAEDPGGGEYLAGGIFSLTDPEKKSEYNVLHRFNNADGNLSNSGLLYSGGALYGTTEYGGEYGKGTVFQITLAGQFTLLHSFAGSPGDGALPEGKLAEGLDARRASSRARRPEQAK